MSHVFVSYAREDSAIVETLAKELRLRGVVVWLDRDDLRPGQWWKRAIRRAISNGAFFLACFSAASVARDTTYMNQELAIAVDELQKRPRDREWFLPVLLTPCDVPDYPIGAGENLKDIHYTRLYSDWYTGIERLISVIQPRMQEGGQASTLPEPIPFAIHVDPKLSDRAVVIALQGEVAVENILPFQHRLTQIIEDSNRHVVVDLTDATFIDSTGLGVLVGAIRRLRPMRRSLSLVMTHRNLLNLFEITGLDRAFSISSSVESALANMDQPLAS
jgi:anti-anti-sigma factor